MRRRYMTDIEYNGITFQFSGQWIPYVPPKITADPYNSEPAEGGYFDDWKIVYNGHDWTDSLSEDVINGIIKLAEREARYKS